MSRRPNPPFPTKPFGLLLVEGGDEQRVCEAVAGPTTWAGLVCWRAEGRDDLPNLARLAALDPGFSHARSVGMLLDVEDDPKRAYALAQQALAAVGGDSSAPVHGAVSGTSPRLGVFLAPDGQQLGSIEQLCKLAVRNTALARCVDALVACAGTSHATVALGGKGWLNAYLAMLPDPIRLHQALKDPRGIDPNHAAFDPLRAFLQSL